MFIQNKYQLGIYLVNLYYKAKHVARIRIPRHLRRYLLSDITYLGRWFIKITSWVMNLLSLMEMERWPQYPLLFIRIKTHNDSVGSRLSDGIEFSL